MYAITIETEPGNAIISFRGSEKVDGNFPPDWIYSDGGIATGKLTYQELMAVKYLDEIEKEYGDKYSSYAITGHSLGGDLALVSTMLTSNSQYVSSEISKKISQSVGFDAPGHPEEFIDKYADNINAMSDVMTHYQYSLVGEIFTSLCEETSRYYHVRADVCFPDISAIDLVMPGLREKQNLELLQAYVLKHSTAMLEFDSYDNLERIESIHRDGLSKFMDLASGLVDRKSTLQNIIGDVSNIYGSIQLMCRYIWKDGEYKSDYEAYLNSIFLEDSIEDLKRTIWLETLDQYMKQVFGSGVFSLLGRTFLDFFINDDDDDAYDAATKTINGTDKQDTICGYRGNDIINGYDGNDVIYGDDGNDIVRGGKGDDVIIGGRGNDSLNGEAGSDTYIFNTRDGADLVDTYAGTNDTWKGDKIKFNDVRAEDVEIQRKNNQLILVNKKTDDRITINAYYNDSWHGVGSIEFVDGTTWDHEYIGRYQLAYVGTDGSDTLTGYDSGFNYNLSEIFYGRDGNDTIRAGKGDDTLIGGRGDDSLTGGAGSDTYIFNIGDGADLVDTYAGTNDTWKGDKIKLNDVKAEDVEIQRKNNQLILVNKKTDDRITINAYYNDSWHGIGNIEFADGTVWDHEYIGQYQLSYFGTDGNDTLTGYDTGFNYNTSEIFDGGNGNDIIRAGKGDDTLIGGRGDDSLTGGAGSDTYIFNIGDGNDLVDTYAGTNDTWKGDKIKFNDVKAEDVEIQRKNNQLILVNKNTDDRITINAYYNDSWHGVGSVEFADGTVWDHEYICQYQLPYVGTDGNDTMTGFDSGFNYNLAEIFYGRDGNDTIRAGKGDDILIGGRGDDILTGGAGSDTYIFNTRDGADLVDTYAGTNDTWKGDKIKFNDVKAEDVEIQRKNNQLILVNKKTDDRITINAYYNDSWHGVGIIEFADGTTWDHDYLGQYQLSYFGTDGNDTLTGYDTGFNYNTSEIFDGGNGNDTIRAGKGDDILIGGRGDDSLTGGAGFDTYIFTSGDGIDIVDTYAGTNDTWKGDKIKLNDVKAEDVEIQRKNNQLILVNKKTDDRITINAYYNDSWHGIGTIEFADGTVWGHEYIGQYQLSYIGTDGNDTLTGYDTGFNYNTSEIFDGGNGNDTIRAGKGDDTLIGGKGDDSLTGGAGYDTYTFNIGDGNDLVDTYAGTNDTWKGDKIKFNDVKAEDVEIQRKNNQLILVNKNTDDRITINAYYNDSWHGIGTIEFADGTTWDHDYIGQYQMTYTGTDGNDTLTGFDSGFNYNVSEIFDGRAGDDTIRAGKGDDILTGGSGEDKLYGGAGNDILVGGAGNDYMEGGTGADIYYIYTGDGNDVIYNYDNTASRADDRLVFGSGIRAGA
ncbi:MAG: DUF2974 domain-containing protein, partial [Lachnospiraceae bacterium]|nr:DUF2974 domain-containing protein [Lachnospiraceae bacterium]